jgi:nucleotide-binding universal stress UspA family protein
MKLGKILVPLDGSALAEAAVWKAIEIGTPGTVLVLLQAVAVYRVPGTDPIEAQTRLVRYAGAYLDTIAAKAREAGVEEVETHVWYTPPAAGIIEAAEAQKVDLIVMSTHGRGGFGRLLLGSVTEAVLRGTRRPVLVLRPEEAPVELPTGARPMAARA